MEGDGLQAEYKRDLQNNYLILESTNAKEGENYSLFMAEKNEIPGLLSFHSVKKDGKLYLHYEITSKQPLESIYGRQFLGGGDLVFLLSSMLELLNQMQKYLLNPMQLVFDPQYIYMSADRRKLQFCYLPGNESSGQVGMLAEFFLKRLNHEERQAVELGYEFYQRTLEENFSLKKTLQELLREVRSKEEEKGEEAFLMNGICGQKASGGEDENRKYQREKNENGYPGVKKYQGKDGYSDGRKYQEQREHSGGKMYSGEEGAGRGVQETETQVPGVESYHVTHKSRREDKKQEGFINQVFEIVHPAVLLSALFFLAVIEIVFYFGLVSLTEAGGLFFLVISAEILANKYWRHRKEEKEKETSRWITEEESEMYRILQDEMYETESRDSEMEETRCLAEAPSEKKIRLICMQQKDGGIRAYPDIEVDVKPILIGKIRSEADVLLDSPTVSRVHAQLQMKGEICCLKDLNSKNGTFCNGERLRPQEMRTFAVGDRISFAEIEYLAVQG